MSLPENPYDPPVVPVAADVTYATEVIDDRGLWRKGSLLVMHKMAPLPNRCVKCNVPTERRLKRVLSWHHPAIFLSLLAGLLIYVIRVWGGYPDGVAFAVLLANMCVPLIDYYTQPRVYGEK